MTKFASLAGVTLDDWQEYVTWGLFDVAEDGDWAATEFGLLVSRQNGKGEILVAYDLAHLFLFPRPDNRRKTILHTAHEVKTAIDGFQRLAGAVQSSSRLMERVHRIYSANGQEGIVLKPRRGQQLGDRIRFIARSEKSGRGFAADVVVYDEAQQLPSFAREALTYTQSAIPNRQELYTGTVPGPLNDSEVFEGVRDRGRTRSGARSGWMEWSPDGSDDPKLASAIDLTALDTAVASIPALNIRIRQDTVEQQVERATDLEALARERFSIWPNRGEETVEPLNDLDIEVWSNNAVPDGLVKPPAVIAIALDRAGGSATVAAASRYDVDSIYVEHRATRAQTMWVAAFVKELKTFLGDALVVLDEKNAAPIISDLQKHGVKFMAMNANEIAAAHAGLIEYGNAGFVKHRGQLEVQKSFEHATTRKVGSSGVTWEPSDPTKPITQAQAVTWAVWGVKKREAAPPKTPATVRGYA